jgi:hypothetical protein
MDKLIAGLTALLLVIPCSAKTLTVDDDGPADYQSIQAALDKSSPGDTILVKPGTYREQVVFGGRRVTVRSENPDDSAVVQATAISYESEASVVFDRGESAESVLTGFTIVGRGILCAGASPTISHNVIRDCAGPGVRGQDNAAPIIEDNQILFNQQEGIYSCHGPIQRNIIVGNSAGLAFCQGPILGNAIAVNGPAGGLYSCDGEIAGNAITGNYAASHGGGLRSCAGAIHNNVIAGNWAGGAGGGLYECTQDVTNNTIAGNRAATNGGGLSRCTGTVCNNIIAYNAASTTGGLYGRCNNTYNAYWANNGGNLGGDALFGSGEVVVDPLFISEGYWDDNGTPDGSDDVWVDGDYHLKSQAGRWDPQNRRWVKDSVTSPGIDAGKPASDWRAELWPHGKRINLGAYGGTPQASRSPVNIGRQADFDHDDHVGPADLKILSQSWLKRQDLLAADLNGNGIVDLRDLAVLGANWRGGPPKPTPPLPNPMIWAIHPYATSPYAISMVATTATSTDNSGVEYYFEDPYHPQHNSGWLSFAAGAESRWDDTGLQPQYDYSYRVKARNRGNRLETGWSEPWMATTPPEDTTPPAPNPLTWQTEPHGAGGNTIRMEAATATDDNGVEYQFECTTHPAYSSAWQDSPLYEVTSLPKGQYTFRVRARDKSPRQNATGWSDEVAVDLQPPTPDPMKWEVAPKETYGGGGTWDYWATMTAVEATDDSTAVEYFFQCTTNSGFNSGWQTSTEYTVKIGRKGQALRFRVKARDTSPSHNETGWSSELPAR